MFHRIRIVLLGAVGLSTLLSATSYDCSTFSVAGASSSSIRGINNAGTVAGTYYGSGSVTHGFIGDAASGNSQTVDYPGAQSTSLLAINNNGVVLGRYDISGQATQYFTFDPTTGHFTAVTIPAAYRLLSIGGINDNGGISVFVQDQMGTPTVDILNPDGSLTPVGSSSASLSELGGPGSALGLVNNAGQVVEANSYGSTYLGDTTGNVVGLTYPTWPRIVGRAVNNRGTVAGYLSNTTDPPYIGFSYDASGAYREFFCGGMSFGAQVMHWQAINDNGVVAGDNYIGTPVSGNPQVSLSQTQLAFPNMQVGQTSAPMSVTVTNTGDARLDIVKISASNRFSTSDFQVSGCVDATTQTASLNPGAQCTLTVTVTPSTAGNVTGTILIDDSADGAPHSIAVSVTATANTNVSASISPTSGSGFSPTFSLHATDSAGYTDLVGVDVLISGGSGTTNACWLVLLSNTELRLYYDDGINSSSITPGSSTVLENSQCAVSGSTFSASGSGNDLIGQFTVNFRPSFNGTRTIYLQTVQQGNHQNGYSAVGSWTVPATTTYTTSVSPSSGNGSSATFTLTGTDAAGYTNLSGVDMLISSSTLTNACWLFLDTNLHLWLAPDNINGWSSTAAGSTTVIHNSQCSISGTSFTASESGNTLSGTFTVNFTQNFPGTKNISLQSVDVKGNQRGYTAQGTWTVPSPTGSTYTTSISPSSGTDQFLTITLTGTDSAGYTNLDGVDMLINGSYSATNACWLYLDHNQRLWLADDSAGSWNYTTVGNSALIQNSQCSISGNSFTASGSGDTLTGTFTIGFTSAFLGAKTIYLQSVDAAGDQRGYAAYGTWTVPGTNTNSPYATAVSPSSGSGSSANFILTATDSAGYANLNGVDMLINGSYNNVNACWLYLDVSKRLWLANDDISNWTYVTAGSSSVIQNSQCSISGTSFTPSESGDALSATFAVTFTPAFTGAKSIYLQSVDAAGNQRGYSAQGSWTVQ